MTMWIAYQSLGLGYNEKNSMTQCEINASDDKCYRERCLKRLK